MIIQQLLGNAGVTTNTNGAVLDINQNPRPNRGYQGIVTGTGAVTATLTFFGSNDGVNFGSTPFGTITLSGASPQSDTFASIANYRYIRVTTSNVTGTGATVTATVAI